MSNISERPDLLIINSRCPKCGYPRGKRDDNSCHIECVACGHRVTDVQIMSQQLPTAYIYTVPTPPDPTACVQGCIGTETVIPWVWIGDGCAEAIVPLGKLRVEFKADVITAELWNMLQAAWESWTQARRASERG